jgi:hypothetical protein
MSDFNKGDGRSPTVGDRVIVQEEPHKGQHGKVTAHVTGDFALQKQYQVKLDNGTTLQLSGNCLQDESLTLNEKDEIANISEQFKKLDSTIPRNIQQELRTHLRYLEESLKPKNKSKFDQQYHYISTELTIGSENGTVTKEVSENIMLSLEKLKYLLGK